MAPFRKTIALTLVFLCRAQAADRFSTNKSWDHIQNKFVGTGHSDMNKFEWISNQHRDTIASNIGHSDMLSFFAVAQNDSIGRVRYQLLEVCTSLKRKMYIVLIYIYILLLFYFSLLLRKCCSRAAPHRRKRMTRQKRHRVS